MPEVSRVDRLSLRLAFVLDQWVTVKLLLRVQHQVGDLFLTQLHRAERGWYLVVVNGLQSLDLTCPSDNLARLIAFVE